MIAHGTENDSARRTRVEVDECDVMRLKACGRQRDSFAHEQQESDLDGVVTASLLERRAYHLGEIRSYANAVLRLSPGHHVCAMATAVLSAADALGANPDSDEHRAALVSCVLALSLALSGTPQDSLH